MSEKMDKETARFVRQHGGNYGVAYDEALRLAQVSRRAGQQGEYARLTAIANTLMRHAWARADAVLAALPDDPNDRLAFMAESMKPDPLLPPNAL